MEALGIDIGGSGIKGAIIDVRKGLLVTERHRIPTPKPAKPAAVAATVAEIAKHFKWQGKLGCGFPAVIQHGIARTAANVHKSWIDTDAATLFSEATGCATTVINDADAAAIAEKKFGAGRRRRGVVIIITVGTGFGTAIFTDGILVPNCELGHIFIDNEDAERWASDAARKRENLSWKKWVKRFNVYLSELERLFWPDLIIIGGGVSKKTEKFWDRLTTKAEIVPAKLQNEAGMIGAAVAAAVTR
jgi:polyphosphate glucokinase